MVDIEQISASALATALRDSKCILVDVREQDEHHVARIPGAKLLPLSQFDVARIPREAGKKLVLACAAGGRSMRAAAACAAAGMAVANLTGGLAAWQQAELPTDRGPNEAAK